MQKAVEFLSSLKNTEIGCPITNGNERLHAKAYLFRNTGFIQDILVLLIFSICFNRWFGMEFKK